MTGTVVAAADIGATQARFRVVDADGAGTDRVCATSEYDDAVALLADGLAEAEVDAMCVAVGGPVTDGRARLTNGVLEFDERAIAGALDIARVALVNDLVALGTEVPHLAAESLRVVGGGTLGAGMRAVIAPGTGLGMALVTAEGGVLPSEGGHAPFAPADPLEQELLGVLAAELRYVSWEDVLSGPGIANLYRAVCAVWGAAPEELTPSDITARGLGIADPVCHQTLEIYCAVLGNAAGGLCVTGCARGGVYLGGGIPPRIADFLAGSGFRRRFEERGRMTGYVSDIGTAVILNDGAGLAGALRYALALVG
ncbi:MAG: glucokinase [Gammaproteobacteria bacterium]|nr:glucokinase [Gammaproteobacteria bacterium]